MSKRKIDHDEEDRDSSEYEDMIEEDDQIEMESKQMVYLKDMSTEQYETEYLNEQEPSTSSHVEIQIPAAINIEYEEVYPHNGAQIVNSDEMIEAEKVYYENEMEDLVYHEIYGEGNEQHKLGSDKRIRNIVGMNAACLVCQRTESEKIKLFKWPKSSDLREQWLHFFRMSSTILEATQEPYICSYHFSADTFVMLEEKTFWKMTALPKYRHRRPGLAEPFPWEPAVKLKMEQQIMNQTNPNPPFEYKIRYRMPLNKHRSRNVHQVAVMTPASEPHLYYEFHFNRNGLNNTKFYACLNCRKAKSESGIRDVIRTIHLDEYKFLSMGDPFSGHHFACRPHNIYNYKSSWRPMPGQSGDVNYIDDVVYVDERGDSLEWHDVTRPGAEMVAPITESDHSKDHPQMLIYDDFEGHEEIIETEYAMDEEPVLEAHYSPGVESEIDVPVKTDKNMTNRMKCHLCKKTDFSSTKYFVEHLQKHIADEKQCKSCGKRISCDSRSICIRRQRCEQCLSV